MPPAFDIQSGEFGGAPRG